MTSTLSRGTLSPWQDAKSFASAIREMLHRIRKPHELAALPLVEALCRSLGISNPVIAVRQVIEDAFEGLGSTKPRLRVAIIGIDIDRTFSIQQVAENMGVSRRHIQRYRAEGVALIGVHVKRLLADSHYSTYFEPSVISSGNALVDLAGLLAKDAPAAAAKVYDLGTPASGDRHSQLLQLRAEQQTSEELSGGISDRYNQLPPSLLSSYAAYAKEVVGLPPDDTREHSKPGNDRRWRFDDVTRLEYERLTFLRARHRGRTLEMKAAANSFRRLAGAEQKALSDALCMQGEAYLRLGLLDEAQQHINQGEFVARRNGDARGFAHFALMRAEISLFEGGADVAEKLASGAKIAFEGSAIDVNRCHAVIARSYQLQQKLWEAPPETEALAPCAWFRITFDIERARNMLFLNDRDGAEGLSSSAYWRAASLGYEGLAARAAANMALCASQARDIGTSQSWGARAVQHLLATQDNLLGAHLFSNRYQSESLARNTDYLTNVVFRRICLIIPQATDDEPAEKEAVRLLLRLTLERSNGAFHPSEALGHQIDCLNAMNLAFSHYVSRSRDALVEIFALLACALRDQRIWNSDNRNVRIVVEHLASNLEPGQNRHWAVG